MFLNYLYLVVTHPFTRGHHYKLYKPQSSCFPYSRPLPFDQSVIGTLCLKMSSVATTCISQFKLLLDHHWKFFGLLLHNIRLTKYELYIIINTTMIINTLQIRMYG